ncbi:hypothetical protein Ccrd_012552 [Cynara cardunculus var. scolymus]|uniref:UDP-glucuronosyl/UDP-glucosyltransferase n=1 Tax=Cynara cardunculus var. scolymus TaxID=59895 RepID=A0A124SHC1_CYNCS|nr:hypothetical protein Ccrd_012552 [Cynara cardunculus var. scolymus]
MEYLAAGTRPGFCQLQESHGLYVTCFNQHKHGKDHVVIPYPAQGHVIPLMEFAQHLIKYGIKVTPFINTEVTHKLVTSTWSEKDDFSDLMQMVSIPGGLEPWDDRNNLGKQVEAIFQYMPAKLVKL